MAAGDQKISQLDDYSLRKIADKFVVVDNANTKTKRLGADDVYDRKVNALTITASAITPDLDNGHKFKVTLTENITVNAPSNPVDGDHLFIRFLQDGTGGRTITLNAIFSEGDDIAFSSLTTTANKTSKVLWEYDAGLTKWTLLALANGF